MQAVIVARVSNDQGGRSASVPEQLEVCRKVCADKGWQVFAEHTDADISASRFARQKGRPGWLAARADVRRMEADVVVMWQPSRGSRDLPDWSQFLAECREYGTKIHVTTHDRTYDPRIARDWKSLASDGVDSAYESELKSEAVRRGVTGALAAGKPAAKTPAGYRKIRDPGNGKVTAMEPDPEMAPRVREMVTAIADGIPVHEAARNAGFARQTAQHLVRNMALIAKRKLADGSIIRCQWEPIVDEATFERAQQVLASHPGAGKKRIRPGAARSLLGNLAICGKCGAWVRPLGIKTSGYRCEKGCVTIRPEAKADGWVKLLIIGWLMDEGNLDRFSLDDSAEAQAAQAEALQLARRLDEATESYNAGRLPLVTIERIEASLRPRLQAAQDRARAASVPPVLARFTEDLDEAEEFYDRASAAHNVFDGMPLAARRDLIREVSEVRIHPAKSRLVQDMVEVMIKRQ